MTVNPIAACGGKENKEKLHEATTYQDPALPKL